MLKQILIAVIAVLLFNAVFVFSGGLDLLVQSEQKTEAPVKVGPDVVDVFKFTLEDEVNKKLGAAEEGYVPEMFLQVFPGLVETDFDGVEASVGRYEIIDGRLQHIPDDTKLMHSAAKVISRTGIETLLYNIADRIQIDLRADGTITELMSAITAN